MSHTNKVFDTDAHFEIDPITRAIKNMTPTKISIMQNDHNSERFTFTIPRFVEGHDMLESDKVEIHYINSDTKEQTTGIYEVTDLQIDETDENNVQCSWLLSRNATKYAGSLAFLVRFVCLNGTDIDYAWNTSIFSGISVGKGLDCSDEVLEEYVDIIEAWKQELQEQIRIWVDESVARQVDVAQIRENKANIEDLTAEQTLLKARVDNLATMEEGSTTGDAELMDIRVGYDGTQYDSAGEAVRGQFQKDADTLDDHEARITQNTDDIVLINDRAIVCDAEGESIHLNDSAKANFRALNIYGKTTQKTTTGKNLIDANILATNFEKQEDGSYKSKKQVTTQQYPFYLPSGNTYTISYMCKSERKNNYRIRLYHEDGTCWDTHTASTGEYQKRSHTKELTSAVVGIGWWYSASSDAVEYKDLQIELGETATEYEEYSGASPSPSPEYPQEMTNIAEDGGVDVNVYGKNLLPIKVMTPSTYAGITYTPQENGSITVKGTVNEGEDSVFHFVKKENPIRLQKGTYYFSGSNGGSETTHRMLIYSTDWNLLSENRDVPVSFTLEEDTDVFVYIWVKRGLTIDQTFFPMISTSIESFEPYKKETLSLSATNGLPGIPVASGGNYTDASGQQWICDEIDLKKGVYIKRINTITLTNDFVINADTNEMWIQLPDNVAAAYNTTEKQCLCSHYIGTSRQEVYDRAFEEGFRGICARDRFVRIVDNVKFNADPTALNTWIEQQNATENPVLLTYILNVPIETPLSEEEIAAYKAIHSHKTTTNIFNGKNAHMAVEYVADTKSYIDNKFIELQNAFLNATT